MGESSRPCAKRPRVEDPNDSFEEAGNGNGGYESFDDDVPTQPLRVHKISANQPILSQPNLTQPNHTQTFFQSSQVQFQSQIADIGQMIMLKKQKENAQNALVKLEKEKARREFEFNKQRRELEERKNREIKNLREELGSLKREYTMMSFRQPPTSDSIMDFHNSTLNTSSVSILPTKKVEIGRPTGFQNRWNAVSNAKLNHSVFKHPSNNMNETFTPMSSQNLPRASTPVYDNIISDHFTFPEKESVTKACQVDFNDNVCTIETSPRERLLEQMIAASLTLPSENWNFESFEKICKENCTLLAASALEPR